MDVIEHAFEGRFRRVATRLGEDRIHVASRIESSDHKSLCLGQVAGIAFLLNSLIMPIKLQKYWPTTLDT